MNRKEAFLRIGQLYSTVNPQYEEKHGISHATRVFAYMFSRKKKNAFLIFSHFF